MNAIDELVKEKDISKKLKINFEETNTLPKE